MIKNADVIVIGGGVVGCSIAYQLSKRGWSKIAVLEKRFLASGSTGRCTAGIRQQWGTELNCRVAMGSLEIFRKLDEELDTRKSIEFQESGYLILAHNEKLADNLMINVKLQNGLGIPSQLLSADEIKKLIPALNSDGVVVGSWCPTDGTANPFYTTLGFAEAAKRMGVNFLNDTLVTGIETTKRKISAVRTNRGKITTGIIVNATGPYAKQIGAMIGVDHPVEPERHQAAITERAEKAVGTYIISMIDKSYITQIPDGAIIMGIANPTEQRGINYSNSIDYLPRVVESSIRLVPLIKGIRILREWAGHAGVSPDGQAIIGAIPEVENYYLALGCGKGFQLSPMIGKLIAELLSAEETSIPIDQLNVERFRKGKLIAENLALEGV